MNRWQLHLLSILAVSAGLYTAGCASSWNTPAHIVYSPPFNNMIMSGDALTMGEIPLGDVRRIVIPSERVVVMEGAPSDQVLVYVDKSLGGGSHPPEVLDIADVQNGMGCCYRVLEDRIEITEFGVILQSGNAVELALIVPPDIEVVTDSSLGATYSESEGFSPVLNPEGEWHPLQETPDPEGARTFRDDVWPREWFVAASTPLNAEIAISGGSTPSENQPTVTATAE